MVAPVSLDMIKLNARGTILTSQSWSTGFWCTFDAGGAWGSANFLAYATAMEALVQNWWQSVKVLAKSTTSYTGMDAYLYPSAATTAQQVANVSAGGGIQGSGTGTNPTQTSLVMSLRTNVSGRRGRGRMYVPATGVPLDSNHQVSSATCIVAANATRDLFDDVNAYVNAPANIVSQRVVIRSAAAGNGPAVTVVLVDSEPDIQRRRADALAAIYTATSSVAP